MRVPEPTVEEIDRLATKYQVTRTDVFLRAANLLLEVERQNAEDGEPEAEALSGIRVSRTR
jgi:hypothetical protein